MQLSNINTVDLATYRGYSDLHVPTTIYQVKPSKNKKRKRLRNLRRDVFLGQLANNFTPFKSTPDIRKPPNMANIV